MSGNLDRKAAKRLRRKARQAKALEAAVEAAAQADFDRRLYQAGGLVRLSEKGRAALARARLEP